MCMCIYYTLYVHLPLYPQCKCKIHTGKKGAERERELILFDKLLLLLKRKDAKRYNYKGHIEVQYTVMRGVSQARQASHPSF